MLKHICRSTFFTDHAVAHKDYMIGNVPGKSHFMGYYQHGYAFGSKIPHDGKNLTYHFRIQCRSGFIEQQHFRVHSQGTGDGYTLFLPAGELAGPGVDILLLRPCFF